MNLCIDIGNTFVKAAVFQDSKPLKVFTFELDFLKKSVKNILHLYNIDFIIVSSVASISISQKKTLEDFRPTLFLDHQSKFPFNNKYLTPNTIGIDRLVLASAAQQFKKSGNVLVIDAGTCVTYDYLDHENNYLGGAISPGLIMRYKSLNYYTSGLPLLKVENPNAVLGNTTQTCMHSGVVNGLVFEIDGVIAHYNNIYKDLTVILTGGDTNFLSKQLKSSIFANSNFLLEGLNYLLNFNLK